MPQNIMPGEHDWMYGIPGTINPGMGFPAPAAPAQPGNVQKLIAALGGPQGLLNLGANLMTAGGPSPVRQNLGSAIGGSLLANQQFQQAQQDQQLKQLLLMSQIQKNKNAQQQNRNHVIGNALVDDTGKVVYQGSALDNTFGRVNPGDYDPASLAKFKETGNWNDLKRIWAPVNPTVQNIGQVPTVVQPSRTGAPPTTFPLSTLPNEVSAASQKAGAESSAQAGGKITGERAANAPVAYAAYQASVKNLESAMSGTATGPIAGRMPAVTAAQQTAEGAQATMAPILKQLFRNAGEGTFTDQDQELLMRMVPTRTDHPEARKAKLAMIDEVVRAKLGMGDSSATSAQPQTSGSDIDALLQKYAPR